jgi:hypothetical protein
MQCSKVRESKANCEKEKEKAIIGKKSIIRSVIFRASSLLRRPSTLTKQRHSTFYLCCSYMEKRSIGIRSSILSIRAFMHDEEQHRFRVSLFFVFSGLLRSFSLDFFWVTSVILSISSGLLRLFSRFLLGYHNRYFVISRFVICFTTRKELESRTAKHPVYKPRVGKKGAF